MMRRLLNILFAIWMVVLRVDYVCGQTTYAWRNDQNGSYNWAETSPIFWWRGFAEVPNGNEILTFDGNNGLVSTNNLANTSRYRIIFNNTGSPGSRTLNGSATNTFFDFGGNLPQIVNNSGVLHTINFPFNNGNSTGATRLELLANSGNMIFGGAIGASGGNRTLVAGGSGQISFNGVISGSGGTALTFVKEGGGVARFAAANGYTGQTQIDNGEVWIESGGSIAAGSGIYVGNGAQVSNTAKLWLSNATGGTTFSNNFTINQGNANTREIGGLNSSGTQTFSGDITNSSTNGLLVTSLNAGGSLTISGNITGSNPVSYGGNGRIILTTSKTMTGANTLLNGVTVALGANSINAFGGIGTGTTINAGATFDLNGFSHGNTETLNINGTGVSGNGAITNNPGLAANVTYPGNIVIQSSTSIIAANGDINFSATNNTTGGAGITFTLGGAFGGTFRPNINIAGSANLTKAGAGTWRLTGTSANNWATNISDGTLQLGVVNAIPAATSLTIANTAGATFDLNNINQQIGSLSGGGINGGAVNLGSGTLTIGNTTSTSFAGNITGTGGLTKVGTGTQTLSGNNTYSGITTINAGDLIYNSTGAFPGGSNLVLAGGRMVMANTIPASSYTPGTLALGGTTNSEIDLGTGSNSVTITFANSSAAGWTAGRRITIRNWTPFGNKNIFFSGQGLTTTQLDVIDFEGYGLGAKFDGATNRIIPRFIYVTQSSGSGNFSASASWLNNDNPTGTSCGSNPATIVIQSGFTLTQDIAYDLTRIENSGTYLSNNVTITLCAGGSFVNNGVVNFTAAGGGTVICSGNATFSGTASSANFALNNLILNNTTALAAAPTIRGNLQLNAGSSVTVAPVYASTSSLVYNTGGTYNINQEWTGNSTTASTGIPQNVTVQNATSLSFPNTNRGCAGNFHISSGNVQLNVSSGDLYVSGDFTNNGTFTHNNRAVFMVGGNVQSLNGTLNATGTTNCLPFLLIDKSSGTVTLNTPVNVTNTLTLTNGTLALGSNNMTITSGNDIAGTSFGTSKMIVADGSGQLIYTTATNKTYIFPIGDNTGGADYSPISITISAGSGAGTSLGMRVVDAAVPASPLNIPTAPADYISRYWVPNAVGFSTIGWSGSLTYAAGGDLVGIAGNLRFSVWHPAPENSWMDYGGGPSGQTLNSASTITSVATLGTSAFITGRSAAPKLFYRSITTGNWSNMATWETATNASFTSPTAALIEPSALNSSGIIIRNPHTVTIDGSVTLDECIVETGSTLYKASGGSGIVNDGAGDDLDIYGTFSHDGGSVVTFNGTVRVRSNATVEVLSNAGGGSSVYGNSSRIWYEHASTFYWKETAFTAFSTGVASTYFFNSPEGVIPNFRVGTSGNNITLSVGGNTVINGTFEVDAPRTVTWNNPGNVTFRNGILGSGNVSQGANSTGFQISGTTSFLGGSGTINLNTAGLQITGGTCTMQSSKPIAGTGTFAVNNGATLDAGSFSLSGSAPFTLATGGTLISANTSGVNGSITTAGTKTFIAGANYTFNGTAAQTTGNLMGATIGTLTINNPISVVLTNNGHSASTLNLQAGIFRCGAGQTLTIPDGGIINGTGGNQDENIASGTIHFHGGGTINATLAGQPQLYAVIVGNGVVNTGVNMAGSGPSNPTILNRLQLNSQGFLTNAPFYAANSTLIYNSGGTYDKRVEMGQTTPGQPGYPWHVSIQNGTALNLLPGNVSSNQSMSGDLNIGVDGDGNGAIISNNIVHDIVVGGNLFIGGTTATGSLALSSVFGADLELNGNYTRTSNGTFTPNNRAIFFTRSGDVSINAPSPGPEVFPFVVVNKTGGVSTTLTLNRSVDISGRLTLTSGRVISTLTNLLNISNGAADDAANGIGYTSGDPSYVDGPLRRNIGTTSGDYQFPVGRLVSSTHYLKGIILRPTANAGNSFTATYERTAPPQAGADIFTNDLLGINNIEYWQIDKLNATPLTATRILLPYTNPNNWRDEDGNSISPCNNCNVAVVQRGTNSGPGIWGYTNAVAGFFSSASSPPEYRFYFDAGFISSKSISNFSPFTFGFSTNIILPLHVLKFDAVLTTKNMAKLTWEIDDPTDLQYAGVEHSIDGIKFQEIATLLPAGKNYHYYHPDLPVGAHYYRIKLKEKNGDIVRTAIKRLMVSGDVAQLLQLSPNPLPKGAAGTAQVWLGNLEQAQLILYDAKGSKIWQKQLVGFGQVQSISLSALQQPAGTYQLVLLQHGRVIDRQTLLIQ